VGERFASIRDTALVCYLIMPPHFSCRIVLDSAEVSETRGVVDQHFRESFCLRLCLAHDSQSASQSIGAMAHAEVTHGNRIHEKGTIETTEQVRWNKPNTRGATVPPSLPESQLLLCKWLRQPFLPD